MSAARVEWGDGVADVRWAAGGEAGELIEALLRQIPKAEVVHLVATVAEGRVWERAQPQRWVVDCRIPERPQRFRAWSPDAPEAVRVGERADLIEAVDTLARALLAPHEGEPAPRPWLQDLRRAHVALLAARDPR